MGLRDRLRGMIGRDAPRAPLRVVPPEPVRTAPTARPGPRAPTPVSRPVGTVLDLAGAGFAGLGAWAQGRTGRVTVVDADPIRAAAAAERLAALGLESHWITGEP